MFCYSNVFLKNCLINSSTGTSDPVDCIISQESSEFILPVAKRKGCQSTAGIVASSATHKDISFMALMNERWRAAAGQATSTIYYKGERQCNCPWSCHDTLLRIKETRTRVHTTPNYTLFYAVTACLNIAAINDVEWVHVKPQTEHKNLSKSFFPRPLQCVYHKTPH